MISSFYEFYPLCLLHKKLNITKFVLFNNLFQHIDGDVLYNVSSDYRFGRCNLSRFGLNLHHSIMVTGGSDDPNVCVLFKCK